MPNEIRNLEWVGSSLKDLRGMPEDVKDAVGHALRLVQYGRMPKKAKVLKGFGGGSVLEIVEDHQGDTYRAVYTVKLADAVYVLHCFQKKSVKGIQTPKPDMELIRQRLKLAEQMSKGKTP